MSFGHWRRNEFWVSRFIFDADSDGQVDQFEIGGSTIENGVWRTRPCYLHEFTVQRAWPTEEPLGFDSYGQSAVPPNNRYAHFDFWNVRPFAFPAELPYVLGTPPDLRIRPWGNGRGEGGSGSDPFPFPRTSTTPSYKIPIHMEFDQGLFGVLANPRRLAIIEHGAVTGGPFIDGEQINVGATPIALIQKTTPPFMSLQFPNVDVNVTDTIVGQTSLASADVVAYAQSILGEITCQVNISWRPLGRLTTVRQS